MIVIVFDAGVVLAGRERRVSDLVAFLDLGTIHRHLAGAVNGHRECTRSRVACVYYEVCLVT